MRIKKLFTEKEREVIRERRQNLIQEERRRLQEELVENFKHRSRVKEFFWQYIHEIPLQILRSKYSGEKLKIACQTTT